MENGNKEEAFFSLYEFKDWMSKQDTSSFGFAKQSDEPHEYCGKETYPKVSKGKMMNRVISDDPMVEEYIDEFIEDGGTILEVNGKLLTIETFSGAFALPRFCVRIKKK